MIEDVHGVQRNGRWRWGVGSANHPWLGFLGGEEWRTGVVEEVNVLVMMQERAVGSVLESSLQQWDGVAGGFGARRFCLLGVL